ncbi:MAG: O-methyltransferase [Phycisphaerales bacterium]|nr:O-methyltransferase [Phycisphaerales bacterium]
MDMTPDRWNATCRYLQQTFGQPGDDAAGAVLADHAPRAREAGLPDIAVTAEVGRFLALLTRLVTQTSDATRRVLEVGTLGGYSGLWIARALPPDARLTTVEIDDRHADFAQRQFNDAGLAERVTIERGPALKVLPRLAQQWGADSLDMVFLDADKREYPAMLEIVRPLIRVGGIIAADNALGSGSWWVTEPEGSLDEGREASRSAAATFNRIMAADPAWESACVPLREGVLAAVRMH